MNNGLLFGVFAMLVLGCGIRAFEKKSFTVQEIALIAFLVTLAGLGRVAFAFIPSAKPTTFIVIISGIVFGPTVGFLVGAFGALVSNFFLGQGPWTILQMLAWGLCGISAGFLPRGKNVENKWVLVVFGCAWGFLFGWLMNLWYWLSFVYPLTWKSWLSTNSTSIWFEVTHAVTNGLFFYFFSRDSIRILKRFKNKMRYDVVTVPSTKG